MTEPDNEFELHYLRERLKDLEALLELSYCLIFKPHEDIVKRKSHLEKYKKKLAEYGIGGGDVSGTKH